MTGISCFRRLSFAGVFAVIGVAVAVMAFRAHLMAGQVILGWFAANAMTLSLAYFINWPRVFGKTEAGTLRWLPALWMAPMLLLFRAVWLLQNIVVRNPPYNEVAPDLFVGRLCGGESLPKDVSVVIDLTAEFPTPRSLRKKCGVIYLPTLDGCPPDWETCQRAFELIGDQHRRIYVCCANGHGRSVTFMATWLRQTGQCDSTNDAVQLIQAARPAAAPNHDQMSYLSKMFQTVTPSEPVDPRL